MLTRAILILVLLTMVASAAPCASVKIAHGVYMALPLQLGWYDGQQAWYSFFGSSDIDWVQYLSSNQLVTFKGNQVIVIYSSPSFTLYPKLKSALGTSASPVYFVTNYQQGPVFTAIPGQVDYSSLWQVNLVTWKKGITPRPIIDAANLPGPGEADIMALDVVVDLPIMATGALSEPWSPAPPGRYRIPQALGLENVGITKTILLPAWPSYASNEITKRPTTVYVAITDTADPALSAHLGANLAPKLAALDDANTETAWYFMKGQNPPLAPAQDMVLEHTVLFAQGAYGWYRPLNVNFDASPILDMQPVVRGTVPVYVTINNPFLVQNLLNSGGLLPMGPPTKMNTVLAGLSPG